MDAVDPIVVPLTRGHARENVHLVPASFERRGELGDVRRNAAYRY
jgi:hypothetical protein